MALSVPLSRVLRFGPGCLSLIVRHERTMKAFLAGVATGLVVTVAFFALRSIHNAEWLISAIKTPGGFVLHAIQADMNAKRYEMAKEKIDALVESWQRFSSGPDSCSGAGISDIPMTFSKMPDVTNGPNVEPDGAANSHHAAQ